MADLSFRGRRSLRRRRTERVVGIVAGLLLGLAVIVLFEQLSGTSLFDAPRLDSQQTSQAGKREAAAASLVVRVRVRAGEPAGGSPVQRRVRRGKKFAVKVTSDRVGVVRIPAASLRRRVAPGTPVTLALEATRPGYVDVEFGGSSTRIARVVVSR